MAFIGRVQIDEWGYDQRMPGKLLIGRYRLKYQGGLEP